jgi:hypothetical protein
MRSTKFVSILLLCLAAVGCGANPGAQSKLFPAGTQNPASEVTVLTANNTSAANIFLNQANGNLGANNVSKLNVHSLLYSGATTKIFAHLLLWFGQSNHMNVGYNSTDAGQVSRQIADMISRGIDGVVIDWYGPNTVVDQATKLVMHEAEKHAGFTFAIMIDSGAMENACSNCSSQQALTQLLQYVEKTYFGSPAYFTIEGQPVITNFNVDNGSVDWQSANGALKTPPRFLFQDQGGFNHPMSDGSYSWVMPGTGDYGLGYLSSFYQTGLSFPKTQTVGATYKGFNDARWRPGDRDVLSTSGAVRRGCRRLTRSTGPTAPESSCRICNWSHGTITRKGQSSSQGLIVASRSRPRCRATRLSGRPAATRVRSITTRSIPVRMGRV